RDRSKPGQCPPQSSGRRSCISSCKSDSNCPNNEKCCKTCYSCFECFVLYIEVVYCLYAQTKADYLCLRCEAGSMSQIEEHSTVC
uniref:WAP domain-containing protein n=1 Tax=Sinocyclocheilus grahami TaxID=75366 RepID=A0A672SE68_SINGR